MSPIPPPGYRIPPRKRVQDDVPPPPPGYELDIARGEALDPSPPPEPPQANVTDSAVDGDTLRLDNGENLRLFGLDAPELKQMGWDRAGNPVPIGQESWRSLDTMTTPGAVPGQQVGISFGRPVAPVSENGVDLGLSQIRGGHALAAPSFMGRDVPRRFRYMQAERLARLNGLGANQTFFQSPQDFRRAPLVAPARETIAKFWDTPTPAAGMRGEVEAAFLQMINDRAVKAEDVAAYAQTNGGFVVNPADVEKARSSADKTGQTITFEYRDAPKVLTNQGDGALGAYARGLGNGVLPGWLEETGAAVDSIGLTPDRENIWNSDRRLADIWANNAAQNESITGYDKFAHPYAEGAGELTGGVVPFLPAFKGQVTSLKLGALGGAYGFASGSGREGSIPERLKSGAIGAGEGVAATVLGSKALEWAAPLVARGWRWVRGSNGPELVPPGISDIPAGPAAPDPGPAITSGYGPDNSIPNGAGAASPPDRPRQPDYLFRERPQPIGQPVSNTQRQAISEGVSPGDVLPISSNQVSSSEEASRIDAGRFIEAKPVSEATALESRLVMARNGRPLPKRGPSDLVTWLRTQGGIKDQGGNLRAMGIDNAPRDLDFARGEHRFGRLIDNDAGLNLDDAALKAWEAGYLPGSERPDINTFLDAIGRTHSGTERFFQPDDLPEVARFEGLRADRRQLQEQSANGPVYVDRSTPATEPQPFPPTQAYEEWPAGGPDFAGNIDLRKLETPQDISRALDFTQRRIGFDAATRGRISHAETERLAADLGMTPEALLGRRKGQAFNAEEALAARQILAKSGNELVNMARRIGSMDNPGDDLLADFRQAWLRHAAIQEQVSGMTAEAGRTLQHFRMLANSRAVRGDVLTAMVGNGGGRKGIVDAANTLLETVEAGPDKFRAVIDAGAKPRMLDKLNEVWINSLLSGPQTHVVNMVSNTLTAIAQIPEHAAASAIGKGRSVMAKADPDRIDMSEVGARTFGLIQGAKEGARLFAQSLRTGEPSDLISKVEGQNLKAVSGIKGEIIRVPTRLLGAEDEFFKGIARRMELNGLAVRRARTEGLTGQAAKARIAELVTNPTDDMLIRSMDYARYVTFQSKLGPHAQKVSAWANDMPGAKLFLPFVRTPTNLLKFSAERSPFAPLLGEWRADFKAGGARRDLAIAKMMVGTGFAAAFYEAALSGKITGSKPPDDERARLLYADGWQPYSMRVGDKWYSYKRLDPFSTTLGTAADLALLPEGMNERQRDDGATLLIASIMGNLASKTWLSGISDVVGVLDDPTRNADNFVQRLGGSLAVPAGVAQIARTIDPTARETETVGQAIQARIPGLSDDLLPKRDVWGREVVSEGGVGPDIVSPVWQSTSRNDPVNRELLGIPYAPGKPGKEVGGQRLTPQQYDAYVATRGELAHAAIQRLIATDEWRRLDPEQREDAAQKAVKVAGEQARAELFGSSAKRSVPPPRKNAVAPPPQGFTLDGEAAGVNVYADLQKAIPGIRFTSGFRTPEYQADMRRRGYRPASNSSHLSGQALDMLPPRGRSLDWLKAQVRSRHPQARLSVHDGHLHAAFPGYFGAPAIGGAKAIQLRNPNAGMVPPPPGYKIDR